MFKGRGKVTELTKEMAQDKLQEAVDSLGRTKEEVLVKVEKYLENDPQIYLMDFGRCDTCPISCYLSDFIELNVVVSSSSCYVVKARDLTMFYDFEKASRVHTPEWVAEAITEIDKLAYLNSRSL